MHNTVFWGATRSGASQPKATTTLCYISSSGFLAVNTCWHDNRIKLMKNRLTIADSIVKRALLMIIVRWQTTQKKRMCRCKHRSTSLLFQHAETAYEGDSFSSGALKYNTLLNGVPRKAAFAINWRSHSQTQPGVARPSGAAAD